MIRQICKRIKPENSNTNTDLCLSALLLGLVLNRKNLIEYGIAPEASLNSIISTLRNERFIPVESNRVADGTANYYMQLREIVRYVTPELRKHQRNEMRKYVERNRKLRFLQQASKFLSARNDDESQLAELSCLLGRVAEKINALLY